MVVLCGPRLKNEHTTTRFHYLAKRSPLGRGRCHSVLDRCAAGIDPNSDRIRAIGCERNQDKRSRPHKIAGSSDRGDSPQEFGIKEVKAMDQADMITLAAPLAEIGAVIGLFVKTHTAPRFTQIEASLESLRSQSDSLKEMIVCLNKRLDEIDDKNEAATKALRADVGTIVTKAHDRINPIEQAIARLEERTAR